MPTRSLAKPAFANVSHAIALGAFLRRRDTLDVFGRLKPVGSHSFGLSMNTEDPNPRWRLGSVAEFLARVISKIHQQYLRVGDGETTLLSPWHAFSGVSILARELRDLFEALINFSVHYFLLSLPI